MHFWKILIFVCMALTDINYIQQKICIIFYNWILKLGKIEVVQWSLDDEEEFSVTLNDEDLSYDTGCGTFELYPTKNIYQFLLLDKVTGRRWHVQWGFESSKRWIKRIY